MVLLSLSSSSSLSKLLLSSLYRPTASVIWQLLQDKCRHLWFLFLFFNASVFDYDHPLYQIHNNYWLPYARFVTFYLALTKFGFPASSALWNILESNILEHDVSNTYWRLPSVKTSIATYLNNCQSLNKQQ